MKDKEKDKEELFYRKAKLYLDKSIKVHVVISGSGKFFNGKIVTAKPEFCEVKDKEEGIVPVFYDEMYKFEKKKPKEAEDD